MLIVLAMATGLRGEAAQAYRISRATGPITIDGSLSDPAWQQATRFDTWYETNPGDNVEPMVRTVGYVTYDDHFLYIGIDCSDPDPSKIVANFGDHDQISGSVEDFAGVILDTRNDGKTGYEFFANAHGTQYDAITDDVGGNEDSSPDFFWDAATKIDAHGWSVEIRIPFTSLRYTNSNPGEWGLVLYRNLPRERRYQIFTTKLPRGGNCFVCHFSKVSGLENLPPGGHLVAAPFMTAREIGEAPALGAPLDYTHATKMGADLKWTPDADNAVDATVNPDFSQVESDVAAISTNERFAIFYPEKRPFFLEDSQLFNTPVQAVYTRTITSPRWGLRSTGKINSDAYTLLVAQDRGGGLVILPSATGSDFADQEFRSTDAIFRIRHDLHNSFVSFLGTDRESGGSHNRVFGPDFQWKTEKHTLTGQLLFSDTRTPNRPDLADEWNGQKLRSHAADLWYSYSTRTNDFYTEYKDYGTNFRADNGFVPQVGYRSNYAEGGHTFWPEKSFFSRLRLYAMSEYDSELDGAMLYRMFSGGFGGDGKYRSFIRIRWAYENYRNGVEILQQHRLVYTIQFSPPVPVISAVTFDGAVGQGADFANSRVGHGFNNTTTADLRPSSHIRIALTSSLRWIGEGSPGTSAGRLFTSQVERVKVTYTFNNRAFARLIVQNQRTNQNQSLYTSAVDQHSGSLATQLLFAYKLNWQTLMYVGAGDLREVSTLDNELLRSNRQVFMKISYAFQR